MKKYGSRIAIGVLLILLVFTILYASGQDIALGEDKVTYDELQEKIAEKEIELNNISSELEGNKEHYNEVIELAQEHEELIDTVIDYRVEVDMLEEEIEDKQNELNKVNGEIAKVKDEPIKVNPGVYYFGEDIETGRYKLKPQEGNNGNVFFRGSDDFGETFGPGKYSIEEYTFRAGDGEELEATIPILLYPVE